MYNKIILLYLFSVSLINNITALPVILICKYFFKKLFIIWSNSYFISVGYLLKYYNTSIYVNNIEIWKEFLENKDPHHILIQNHLTQYDFLFLSRLISVNNKIITNHIRTLPWYATYILLPGFSIMGYLSNYIMISLNKKKTIKLLENCKINNNDFLFFYPEGAVFCTKSKEQSDMFCDNNNIPRMKNCMYPRSGALDILHKNNNIKTIYSLSTKYNIDINGKYYTLINNPMPNEIYFKINKHIINDNLIFNQTVKIFRDIDDYIDNYKEYKFELIESKPIELYYFIFHMLFFISSCYVLITNYFVTIYFFIILILYYTYVYFDIK